MSATESIRRELDDAREALNGLRREESRQQSLVGQLEARLEGEKDRLATVQSRVAHQNRVIDALGRALAVLTEALPAQQQAPRPSRTALEDAAGREVARSASPEPESSADEAEQKHKRSPGHAEPLRVNRHPGSAPHPQTRPRSEQRRVEERAAELDLAGLDPMWLERADLLALILVEEGPSTNGQMAEHLAGLIDECSYNTATAIVSRALPILFRQGRIERIDDGPSTRGAVWQAKPAEVASAHLGTDVDDYAGTTTRWPSESEKPPSGTRVSVETNAFETGKGR